MSFQAFQESVLSGFRTGFIAIRPAFPIENVLFGQHQKSPPGSVQYLRVVFADLEGDFFALGQAIEQTALLTVDIYIPEVDDLAEVGLLADDVLSVIKLLVLPDSGRKKRLGKRDFANSLGGFAHSRVSVTLVYDVK